jgi:hypothetical protein
VVEAVEQLQALKDKMLRLQGLQQAFADGRQSQLEPLIGAVCEAVQQQQQQS